MNKAPVEAELIAIGSEILKGFTVNSNVSEISQKLLKVGIHCKRQVVVGDAAEAIQEAVRGAMQRSSLVITTGGLGPTCDDISRHVVADLFQSPFSFNKEVAVDLKRRFGNKLASLEDQATLPSKAKVFLNPVGTAPALAFESEAATVILLPGVPEEMRALLSQKVIPYLEERFAGQVEPTTAVYNFFGVPESAIDPEVRHLQEKYPELLCGIYPRQGIVTVRLSAFGPAHLKEAGQYLTDHFGDHLFGLGDRDVEEMVHEHFIAKGLTLSTAESCTGGAIASRLTQLAGASNYFLGAVISYANEVKKSLLKVTALEEYGAVSQQTVAQMAQGVIELTGSDYSVATSGIAGPSGGTAEKPVGTVWCAIGRKGKEPLTWSLFIPRPREIVITRAVNLVLATLICEVKR